MDFEITYSQERFDKMLYELSLKEEEGDLAGSAKIIIDLLFEVQKKTMIYDEKDEKIRMNLIKLFTKKISQMTFSEFILAFPRDDGGTYHDLEKAYKKFRLGVNCKIGVYANEVISNMNVNSSINLFKEKVEEFRNDRKEVFYGNGEPNMKNMMEGFDFND